MPCFRHQSQTANGPQRDGRGFTIVEVMMASVILVVGFIGMISAITIGSEMLATARRQTIAAQILDHEIGKLRLSTWTSISALIDSAGTTYNSDLTSLNNAINSSGVTFNLERDVTDLTTDLREVTFIVTWTKSGTTSAAATATGSWLERLSFSGAAPIQRTYTRKSAAWFGRYGLNLNMQR
jgi:Tfp pilus assembly protein PilV